MTYKNVVCIADKTEKAQQALQELTEVYGFSTSIRAAAKADVIIALGGDGFMLHTLHRFLKSPVPVYGINCGTIGFLMNEYRPEGLKERLDNARKATVRPLEMVAKDARGKRHEGMAINEVSLFRQSPQAAHIRIKIDGVIRVEELIADGVLVATSAGSTAYNLSVGGPIIPVDSKLMALTPISPFRPRRWNGALLPRRATVTFEILDYQKRPVSAVADFNEVRNIVSVEVREKRNLKLDLLFDPGHSLEERIIREQFVF